MKVAERTGDANQTKDHIRRIASLGQKEKNVAAKVLGRELGLS